MNKTIPKKTQHFIPQGYLRKFSIEGEKSLIWQYDKLNGLISEHPVSIRKVCFRNFYYYQRDNRGEIDHIRLEDAFSRVENAGIKVINKLNTETPTSKLIITGEECGQLSFFIALMLTRGPGFRDGINQTYGWVTQQSLNILYDTGKIPEPPKILKDIIAKKGIDNVIDIKIFPEVSLKPMIEMARAVALTMLKKIWIFYIPSDKNTFITSDNPVSFGLAEGLPNVPMGPLHPYAEITIPLKNNLALTVTPSVDIPKEKASELQYLCLKATEQNMICINKRTAAAALQYVYSSQNSEELLSLIKSLKNKSQKLVTSGEEKKRFSIVENPYLSSGNLT